MSNKEDIKFEWWKLASEKNPDPVAFVGLDNKFVFCNYSWCKLLGYSESELREKTWQDITKIEDVGSDEAEVNDLKKHRKEEYYLEKAYIRKDKSFINVKIYVHRYPEIGEHEGCIVFAKRVTTEDYEDLKSKFLDLQKTVLILQQNSIANEIITQQMELVEQKLEQNKELAKMAIQRNNITIGDKFGDNSNKAGRDNISGLSNTNMLIIIFLLFTFILCLSIGAIVLYVIMNKPAIL